MPATPSQLLLDASPRSPTAPTRWPPEAENRRSRASEFYGFVAWTSTYLLFVLYILWALLPDEWIQWTGVTWYPNREWALLVPSWTVVVVIFTYVSYFALAIRSTPSFNDMSVIADSHIAVPSEEEASFVSWGKDPVPEIYDIPIGVVNAVLYRESLRRATSA